MIENACFALIWLVAIRRFDVLYAIARMQTHAIQATRCAL